MAIHWRLRGAVLIVYHHDGGDPDMSVAPVPSSAVSPDINDDGVVNLLDVAIRAPHLGATCE